MSFITTQTFDFRDNRDELAVIAAAIDLIGKKEYTRAVEILLARHDQLTTEPKLKMYDPRAA